jgi:hypothetical protein
MKRHELIDEKEKNKFFKTFQARIYGNKLECLTLATAQSL